MANINKLVESVDKDYKEAIGLADPAERKLLVRSHAILDQIVAAAKSGDADLYDRLSAEQDGIFRKLDLLMALREKEEEQ